MTDTNTGGPAFPTKSYNVEREVMTLEEGMTLRDYFAAKAMQAIYSAICEWEPTGTPTDEETLKLYDELATDAYLMANAMLKARGA